MSHKLLYTSQKKVFRRQKNVFGLRSAGGPKLLNKVGPLWARVKSAKVRPTPYVYYPRFKICLPHATQETGNSFGRAGRVLGTRVVASPGSYGYGALEGDVVTCFISSELNSIFTSQISLVAFSLVYNYIRTPTAHWLHFGVSEPRDDAVRCPHTSGPSVVSGYYSSTGCSSTNTTVCSRAREQGRRHKGHHQGQRLG